MSQKDRIKPIGSIEEWKRILKRAEELHRKQNLTKVSQMFLKLAGKEIQDESER